MSIALFSYHPEFLAFPNILQHTSEIVFDFYAYNSCTDSILAVEEGQGRVLSVRASDVEFPLQTSDESEKVRDIISKIQVFHLMLCFCSGHETEVSPRFATGFC